MKKLFKLKMEKNISVAQHLNEFNTIGNQLSSVQVDFDDEIHALIILASLPHSWDATRMEVSNYTKKSTHTHTHREKYNDILDLILVENVCRRDIGETSKFGSTLNL